MMIDALLKFARSRLAYLASKCPKAFVRHLSCTTCSVLLHSSLQSLWEQFAVSTESYWKASLLLFIIITDDTAGYGHKLCG